jgi:hypothetical protein
VRRKDLRKARRVRRALRLSGVVLLLLSVVLPDHFVAVITMAMSLLSERVTKYLRLI